MNEIKHDQQSHKSPNHNKVYHDSPYWTRAHRDWRVWIGVVLMLICMVIYLMTGDLRWRPGRQPQPPVPAAIGQ
jgi:hypothetical protein